MPFILLLSFVLFQSSTAQAGNPKGQLPGSPFHLLEMPNSTLKSAKSMLVLTTDTGVQVVFSALKGRVRKECVQLNQPSLPVRGNTFTRQGEVEPIAGFGKGMAAFFQAQTKTGTRSILYSCLQEGKYTISLLATGPVEVDKRSLQVLTVSLYMRLRNNKGAPLKSAQLVKAPGVAFHLRSLAAMVDLKGTSPQGFVLLKETKDNFMFSSAEGVVLNFSLVKATNAKKALQKISGNVGLKISGGTTRGGLWEHRRADGEVQRVEMVIAVVQVAKEHFVAAAFVGQERTFDAEKFKKRAPEFLYALRLERILTPPKVLALKQKIRGKKFYKSSGAASEGVSFATKNTYDFCANHIVRVTKKIISSQFGASKEVHYGQWEVVGGGAQKTQIKVTRRNGKVYWLDAKIVRGRLRLGKISFYDKGAATPCVR